MKILILDNYDSFTYNLVQIVEEITGDIVDVVKNDKIDFENVSNYDAIILSPGPGIPSEAGKLIPLIQQCGDAVPMLGVCLGHQAMAEAFGGELEQLETVYHGVASNLVLKEKHELYDHLGEEIQIGRYHSWAVKSKDLPSQFVVTATDKQGIIMSFYHKEFPLTGVQYHPESILTPEGKQIIINWLNHIK